MALEEEFDTEIPDEEAEKITTVQAAIDYINGPPGVSEHLRAVVRPPEFYLFVPLESFFSLPGGQTCLSVV